MTQAEPFTQHSFPPRVENPAALGRVMLICEHASCHIPPRWGDLGLTADQARAHIAWDPGALDLARGLSQRLDAVLIHAPVSRLVYDCNRAPDQPGAMPARSELHDIPGNATLSHADRAERTAAVYAPFHAGVQAELARRIALGVPPVIITVHSFTPVYFGQRRAVEFGVIHDGDDALALAVLAAARARTTLKAELNAPYSAADGVTHTLRLHALPYGLPHAMLEIRNDLLASPAACDAMAATLAPLLAGAVASLAAHPALTPA